MTESTDITLVCPVCRYTRTLSATENYTQADLMCPSEEHPDTDLVRVSILEEEAHDDEPPAA